jgi:hypothetical protein
LRRKLFLIVNEINNLVFEVVCAQVWDRRETAERQSKQVNNPDVDSSTVQGHDTQAGGFYAEQGASETYLCRLWEHNDQFRLQPWQWDFTHWANHKHLMPNNPPITHTHPV